VQSPDILPLPTLEDSNGEARGYLKNALQQALHTSTAFLSSIWELHTSHSHASNALRAAPEGFYILFYAKKDSSSHHTNFVISIEDPAAYAMLATQTDPTKTGLNTNTTSNKQTKQQITYINITTHTSKSSGAPTGSSSITRT
jgi:hypothetical protein